MSESQRQGGEKRPRSSTPPPPPVGTQANRVGDYSAAAAGPTSPGGAKKRARRTGNEALSDAITPATGAMAPGSASGLGSGQNVAPTMGPHMAPPGTAGVGAPGGSMFFGAHAPVPPVANPLDVMSAHSPSVDISGPAYDGGIGPYATGPGRNPFDMSVPASPQQAGHPPPSAAAAAAAAAAAVTPTPSPAPGFAPGVSREATPYDHVLGGLVAGSSSDKPFDGTAPSAGLPPHMASPMVDADASPGPVLSGMAPPPAAKGGGRDAAGLMPPPPVRPRAPSKGGLSSMSVSRPSKGSQAAAAAGSYSPSSENPFDATNESGLWQMQGARRKSMDRQRGKYMGKAAPKSEDVRIDSEQDAGAGWGNSADENDSTRSLVRDKSRMRAREAEAAFNQRSHQGLLVWKTGSPALTQYGEAADTSQPLSAHTPGLKKEAVAGTKGALTKEHGRRDKTRAAVVAKTAADPHRADTDRANMARAATIQLMASPKSELMSASADMAASSTPAHSVLPGVGDAAGAGGAANLESLSEHVQTGRETDKMHLAKALMASGRGALVSPQHQALLRRNRGNVGAAMRDLQAESAAAPGDRTIALNQAPHSQTDRLDQMSLREMNEAAERYDAAHSAAGAASSGAGAAAAPAPARRPRALSAPRGIKMADLNLS